MEKILLIKATKNSIRNFLVKKTTKLPSLLNYSLLNVKQKKFKCGLIVNWSGDTELNFSFMKFPHELLKTWKTKNGHFFEIFYFCARPFSPDCIQKTNPGILYKITPFFLSFLFSSVPENGSPRIYQKNIQAKRKLI